MAIIRTARIAAPLLSIILLHVLILHDRLIYAPGALALGVALTFVLGLVDGARGRAGHLIGAIILAVLIGFQAMALYINSDLAITVAILPVAIHLWVAWVFGRTLLHGREPLIRRFSRLSRGEIPPELENYTRRLTIMWTIAMVIMALIAAVTAVLLPPKIWSWVVNFGLPLASVVLFLGEHCFRAVRFAHLGENSPLKTLRTLTRPHLWMSP